VSNGGPEWFAAKRYGYGPGKPTSWQGWAVTIIFMTLGVRRDVPPALQPRRLRQHRRHADDRV
jgi:hypothetical protein